MQNRMLPDSERPSISTTAAGNSSSSASKNPLPSQQQGGFPEASITKIVQSGFTRSEAIEELATFSGDTDKALASLFAKALQF